MSVKTYQMGTYFSVGLGGIVGALCRYGISMLFVNQVFPLATLLVNLVGCFLLPIVSKHLWIQKIPAPYRLAVGTGFLGSFTTFSTFSLETWELLQENMTVGLAYILITVFGGLSLAWLGFEVVKRKERQP
ncbi:fluoride efflux transporter CrcB [Radiobacillus kanasensis]|uniref:fluoride efflux transporter CrcB n=1 Tax=Radiobacillus kanasensis TaxID=2844358 RepID=UPI001E6445D8|nr:fluoride efflux transporter CrcB [Radiobacillus kanasensis]UFT98266.1 fluoride efflux transporter CrcB [Radiobacillus kanasensis]